MALGDPIIDPTVEQPLYGAPFPDLTDMAPAGQPPPWDMVPDGQGPTDEEIARQHLGGLPPLQPPPGHVAGQDPFLDAMYGVVPQQAQPPGPPPLPLAGNPWASPPPEALPQSPFAPMPNAPDALSGVGGMAPVGDLGGVPYAPQLTPEQGYQQAAKSLTQSPFDPVTGDIRPDVSDADAQRYFDELYQRDPLRALELNQHLADIKTSRVLAERKRIENQNWERQQQLDADRKVAAATAERKSNEIAADAQRILNEHIDPSGGVTGGRAVAGILAAFMGGLVQGKTGSPVNAGLDALNTAINRGIDAQKADLQNRKAGLDIRRSLLADEMARHGDEYRAQEAMRVAAMGHAINMLDIEMQDYSPRGTAFAKAAAMKAGLIGQMAQSEQVRKQKDFENSLKFQDAARQQQIADETARHNRSLEGIERAKANAANDKGPIFTPEQWKIIHPDNPLPPIAMSQKDYGSFLDARVKGNEIGKVARERTMGGEVTPVTDDQGNVVGRKLGPIMMADGKTPFEAKGTETQVTQLEKQHVATVQLLGTIDEIRRIGPEWLSDTANSDKLQRLKQLMGSARLQAIAANNLGVPTGHDIELAEDFVGTSDPTRRKDSLAGITSAREALIRNHNVELKARGLDKEWDPGDPLKNLKKPQPGDEAFKDVLRNPRRDFPVSRIAGELGLDPSIVQSTHSPDIARVDAAYESSAGMLPSIKLTLDTIAGDLRDADPKKREAAAAKLEQVFDRAESPAAKSYAQQLLVNSIAPGLPQTQEQVR